MTIINLKDMYSNYYIRQWKKEGLPLIKERPPQTTEELLERFFATRVSNRIKSQKKAIAKTHDERVRKSSKLDWRDYLKEEYQ